jgi:AmmeMemoRadiSam system protein B
VELPFLLARQPGLRIVPVVLSGLRETEAVELGSAILRAITRVGADPQSEVLLVASSDMSHYLPDSEARRVDRMALEPLLDFDPTGLYRTVVASEISMCGFIPATAMLSYARELGAKQPELIGYATSGDAFGDTSRVVGYAGVVVAV